MKKYAAAAIIAALALSGCAGAQAVSADMKRGPVDNRATYVEAPSADMMLESIRKGWVGADAPDAEWLSTASLLVCKQIIGGIEPRVTPDHANNELVVSVVEWGVCEIDR